MSVLTNTVTKGVQTRSRKDANTVTSRHGRSNTASTLGSHVELLIRDRVVTVSAIKTIKKMDASRYLPYMRQHARAECPTNDK